MKLLCFICTGNYYRSRFAEECFNSIAKAGLSDWRATSRGIGNVTMLGNPGSISDSAVQELRKRGYPVMSGSRMPERLKREDTGRYELFVCLNRNEHENALAQEYGIPGEKIICWDILDVEESPSEIEMERLERLVRQLTETLQATMTETSNT